VFHVSLLAPYHPRAGEPPTVIQPDLIDGVEEWEVESILNKRVRRNKVEYLVHWKEFPVSDDEWVREDQLENSPQLIQDFEKTLQANEPHTTRKPRHRRSKKKST
jgi:hypothetical protein